MQTSEETLKAFSEAVDAFASAKVANNESLIRFAIANLQQFINEHDITPKSESAGIAGGDGSEEA